MRKHDSFEDDGRTIADMSGIGPAPTLLPRRSKPAAAPEPANHRGVPGRIGCAAGTAALAVEIKKERRHAKVASLFLC